MKREEILEKSRKENIDGDERQYYVQMKKDSYATIGMFIMLIIFGIIRIINDKQFYDLVAIALAGGIFDSIASLKIKSENKSKAIFYLVFGILLLIYALLKYFNIC